MKLLLDNGNQHVGRHGAPDLRLDGVLAGAQKALDAQVLLDPLEEQFHLPAVLVQRGDGQRRQRRVVRQKHQGLAGLRILEADAAQMLGQGFGDVKAVHGDRLIAHYTARAIGLARVDAPGVHAALGAGDKEGSGLMHLVQPREVQVTAVHDVKSPSFDGQDVEHLDIAHLAVADVDEGGNGAAQVQQRVHLHRRFGGAKRRPIEQTQAQVDGRGVQCVDGGIDIDVQRLAGVQLPGACHQAHGQRVVDAPVPQTQGVCQRRARRHTLHTHVKQLGLIGAEADLDIAQGFAPRQLRKGHDTKQVGAAQGAHTHVAAIPIDDAAKVLPRHVLHDLRKQCLAYIHAAPSVVQTGKHRKCANLNSNRGHP